MYMKQLGMIYMICGLTGRYGVTLTLTDRNPARPLLRETEKGKRSDPGRILKFLQFLLGTAIKGAGSELLL